MQIKNRALLITVGVFPAVVTETLYALDELDRARGGPKPRTKVRMLTTESGQDQIRSQLLDPRAFAWLAQERELLLEPVEDDDILVFQSPTHGVDDIRSPDDVLHMSDMLCREVLQWANQPGWSIHASIAGGRKPMSMQLGFAMTMLGRPGDELSHILTLPERPDDHCERTFLFPTPNNPGSESIELRLIKVPILLLGGDPLPSLHSGKTSYSEIVATAQALFSPAITFDLPNSSVLIAGHAIRMTPAVLAPYAWAYLKIARRESIGMPPTRRAIRKDITGRDKDGLHALRKDPKPVVETYAQQIRAAREMLAIYDQIPHSGSRWKGLYPFPEASHTPGLEQVPCLTQELLAQNRSKAHRAIAEALGAEKFARPYELTEDMIKGKASAGVSPASVAFLWDDQDIGRALVESA